MFPYQNRSSASIATLSVLAVFAMSPVCAQEAGKGDASEKKSGSETGTLAGDKKSDSSSLLQNSSNFDDLKVSIYADRGSLVTTLRSLLKSVKANFVIDNTLNEGLVSIQVKDIPFKTALKLLMRVSSLPVEWDQKDGVFHFRLSEGKAEPDKKDEKAAPAKEPLLPPPPRIEKIKLQNSDAKETLDKLLGKNLDQPSAPIILYDSSPPGRSRSNFFQFINGRLTSGSGATGPNGAVQGGSQSTDVGRLLRQFFRFP